MPENKSSLNNMLTAVTAIANIEQDLHFPPSVFSAMYNICSSWLLTKVAEVFPTNNRIVDIAEPFLKTEVKLCTNGYVQLPATYRNFLDAGIGVNKNATMECDDMKSIAQQKKDFENNILKAGCQKRPLLIVDQSQWDYLTTDSFDFPTYENPIGCFFGTQKIKVCPFDITAVEIRYLKNEGYYEYGYTMQPDDTYVYDASTTTDSEWTNGAFSYLFKGMMACYAAYAENNNIRDFSLALKNVGLT